MEKLIRGIIDFQSQKANSFRDLFSKLALGQTPDSFFLACSDSRVAANVFASTDPGDLFVMRNVGNIFPEYSAANQDHSAQAVLEFAVHELKVKHLIVCGHSECGGMIALTRGLDQVPHPGLRQWLKHGESSLNQVKAWSELFPTLEPHNALSQLNVIHQLENLRSYAFIDSKLQKSELKVHGLWFDIKNLQVLYYFKESNRFEVICRNNLDAILGKL